VTSLTAPTATDNCGGTVTVTHDATLPISGEGTTTIVTWTYDDGNGNTSTQTQNVIIDDVTAPIPDAVNLSDITAECEVTSLTAPTATDNCGGTVTVTHDATLPISGEGTTTVVTWTYDDGNGNTSTQTQNVIIDDVTVPTPDAVNLSDITAECEVTSLTAPTATDNCGGTVTVTHDATLPISGEGTTTIVTWTYDDGNGNTSTQTQNVIIDDVTAPTPDAVSLSDITAECEVTSLTAPTATDNCGGTVTVTHDATLPISGEGTTTVVTWTYDDGNGNTSTQTQNVIIDDVTAPIPDAVSLSDITAECEVTSLTAPTATDNCGGTVTVTHDATLPITTQGTTLVTWTYIDENSNASTQTQNVIITDVTPPTALCQPITIQLSSGGTANISASDINNGSNDNCGIQSLALDITTFDCSNVGDNTVTLTVTDINGLSSTCQAIVTVEDNDLPIANDAVCGSIGPLVLDAVTGEVTVTQAQINAAYTGTDACGIDTIILTRSTTFGCDDVGSYGYEITITDVNGNSDTCEITISIEAPTIAGGVVLGYIDEANPQPADDLIEVTFCPYDMSTDPPTPAIQGAIFNLTIDPSLVPNIIRWEIATYNAATAFWEWVPDGLNPGNPTEHVIANVVETTLVRAVIQSGDCFEYSSEAILKIIPPDDPPTIVGLTIENTCFPPEFTIEASSFYEYTEQFGDTGLFNSAQPEGWMVDGVPNDIPASGNNTTQGTWKEVAQEKELAGIRHFPQEGSKYAAVYGSVNSTLETPVFNTIGMSAADARIEFYHAFYLCAGASAVIELSLDGGATYTEVLATYTGQSDTGMTIVRPNGNPNNCNSYDPIQDGYEFISLDLSSYLNEGTLRVKFSFFGDVGLCSSSFTDTSGTLPCSGITRTVGSSWALDGVRVPYAPIDEVLEWTDDEGNVVTTGTTVTVTPVTPGTQQYGVTSLVNGCRANDDQGTQFVTLDANLAYAGLNFSPGINECGQSTIDLKAYDNTISALTNYNNGVWEPGLYIYPGQSYDHDGDINTPNIIGLDYNGTGMGGEWTWGIDSQECNTFMPSFSDINDPNAQFTAPPGIYNLTWTLANGCSDTIQVTISSCSEVNFDGVNDFVSFKNNYAFNSDFSLEAWVKPDVISGTHTIFSKRILGNIDEGYDLSLLNNGRIRFSWFTSGADGYIQSDYSITTNRWYHIAVTFDGTNYVLYIDGIDLGTVTGTQNAPDSTTANVECLLGALDPANGTSALATHYFDGRIDELRIWNTALTAAQIRQMMNQEIEDNTAVRGAVVPLDIAGLSWTDLDGYYRMGNGCGDLAAQKGPNGRLRNINTSQIENAPLPYTSRVDGQDWATDNTWTEFVDWDAPNSIGVDGVTPIDWNIVQTSHHINSGNKDITVLGLISDTPNKTLNITDPGTAQDETNDGQSLRITHYLKLDGNIDLFGESQLLQDEGSVLDVTSAGQLERDQQGTSNLYNYNYWSSPVSTINVTSNNTPYNVNGILRDGSNSSNPLVFQWTGAHDANGSTTPITMSNYWLFAYENYPFDSYASWRGLNQTDNIATGLSFTMKGSGVGDPIVDVQNYVFVGKPNNGTITTPVTVGNQALVGNPYPSAIDANAFILDNIPGGNVGTSQSIDGTLYFWEHYTSNFTHILEDYEGGYATYNLTGGNPAVSPPLVSGNGTPTKLPGRYVPVSQGFFVTASASGGTIQFKNSQRVFVKETPANSQFIRSSNPNLYSTEVDPNSEIKRVRLEFKTTEGAKRPLLLGFVPGNQATDGFDAAYDAENSDAEFPNDMFWRIEDQNYTTQGVGDFDSSKQYPLIVYVNNAGLYEIALTNLENFDNDVNVYIYDALLETYTDITSDTFQIVLDGDTYINRFYITFSAESSLSTPETHLGQHIISYFNSSQEIYVSTSNIAEVKAVKLNNLLGQEIKYWDQLSEFESDNTIRIPMTQLSEGTYVIQVETFNATYHAKVIVKH
ncbi:LamG-like jellyroll fold domain-containing protein, partial [Psychroserpens sp. SPM9]|uniref:LamG-like jellyroll fold domain-containing protein n=1 Tax=Psychroserpens sp. SPM9 TaxID=2975598 RepID=UPI0021A285F5